LRRYFIPLAILTFAIFITFQRTGSILNTHEAPNGIISFELAGSVIVADSILDSWSAKAREVAAFSLGLDYLFLVAYSSAFALACIWASRTPRIVNTALYRIGLWLAWGQFAAGLFDAIENGALITILLDAPKTPWPEIARICALIKFSLLGLALVYILLGVILRLLPARKT
jgi:hypothetical protein